MTGVEVMGLVAWGRKAGSIVGPRRTHLRGWLCLLSGPPSADPDMSAAYFTSQTTSLFRMHTTSVQGFNASASDANMCLACSGI